MHQFYYFTIFFCSLLSPEPQRPKSLILDNLSGLVGSLVTSPATSNSPGSRDSQKRPLLVPDVEEIRVSPLISKRGNLNILDHKTKVKMLYSDWNVNDAFDLTNFEDAQLAKVAIWPLLIGKYPFSATFNWSALKLW